MSKIQKAALLFRMLADTQSGILQDTKLHTQIADLILEKVDDDENQKNYCEDYISCSQSKEGRTTIALGVSSSLADLFLQEREVSGNEFAAKRWLRIIS